MATAAVLPPRRRPALVPSLTGLRGVAALVVVLYHYMEAPHFTQSSLREPFPGYLGVDLFFVLSGFLMALNYRALFEGPLRLDRYRLFLERRFARVYPLYLLVVLLVFAAGRAGLGGPSPWRSLASNLLLVQMLGPGLLDPRLSNTIVGPSWSISTELGAYLLFPLLLRATVLARTPVAVLAGATAWAALVLIAALPWSWKPQGIGLVGPLDVWNGAGLWPLLRCLADFTLGLIGFRLATRARGTVLGGDPAGVAIGGATALLWLTFYADVVTVLAFALLIVHLSFERSRLARLLGSRPFLFLGDISYALYLWHIPLIAVTAMAPSRLSHGLAARAPYPAVASLTFAMAVLLAWLSFRHVERPARRLLRRWFEGRSPPAIAGDPPAP